MTTHLHGWAETAFASCFDAFQANFTRDGELGAACAVYQNGKLVCDMWGGIADQERGALWRRETAVPVFSVTKGVAALCILRLVDDGLLQLDQPVAKYWPEFGANQKALVTVREALGHRAGVPLIDGPVTIDDLSDPKAMSARLARQRPIFVPGSAHAYHAITVGWITTELVRRLTGKPLGEWLKDTWGEPLSLNLHVGGQPPRSLARIEVPTEHDTPTLDPMHVLARPISLNGLIKATMSGLAAALNDEAFQRVELAGASGVADARSLAKLYAATVSLVGESRVLSDEVLKDASKTVSEGLPWNLEESGPKWGAGLMLPWRVQPMLGEGSFGHDGAGGSLAFAHLPSRVSFAYVRNRAGVPGAADPLVYRVVSALAAVIGIQLPTF